MTGLRKILLFMLVTCTLGYGSAWAYDGHSTELDRDMSVVVVDADSMSDQTVIDKIDGHETEQHSVADVTCDHSCHISAHLQAIFTQNNYVSSVNQSSELLEFSENTISFTLSPNFRPPRV